MQKYKDLNNKVHEIDSKCGVNFLNDHSPHLKPFIKITDAEADDLLKPLPQTDDEFNAIIDIELRELDLSSIRSIREYIAAKPDAPLVLKNHEINASAKRAIKKP